MGAPRASMIAASPTCLRYVIPDSPQSSKHSTSSYSISNISPTHFIFPGSSCSFSPMRARRSPGLLQRELPLHEVSEHMRAWQSYPQRRGHRWTSFLACSNYVLVCCHLVDLLKKWVMRKCGCRKKTFGIGGTVITASRPTQVSLIWGCASFVRFSRFGSFTRTIL